MSMTELYPGSSRKRKVYAEEEPVKPKLEDLLELGKPKYYLLNNKPTPLYRIGALARALNRKTVTIRKWEQEGVIPMSPMMSSSFDQRGKRRLYTKEQIESLRNIAYEENILHPSANGKWRSITDTQFKQKAAKAFSDKPKGE